MSSRQKFIWPNIIFFAITTVFAVAGCPLYIRRFGISVSEILLFVFYLMATGISITAGYHRFFSHATYKANPFIQFLFLFFGAAAFEQTALTWSSQHRDHHRFVDTDRDPYSIKKGFFYAHMGWLIFWEHDINYENVQDLRKNKLVMHQHVHYYLWAVTAGILTPLFFGALSGHFLGAFLFSVCLRLTVVYHSTFCINSICHMFGKATYDIYASAKDHWLVAFVTNGEGYHNFHHRFPSDYRNGVRWYQWDPSKWLIALMGRVKLAWDLKRISDYRILEARLAADNLRIRDSLQQTVNTFGLHKAFEALKGRYDKLKQSLADWETVSNEYRMVLQEQMDRRSREIKAEALRKVSQARRRFKLMHERWLDLINHKPLDLKRILLSAASA